MASLRPPGLGPLIGDTTDKTCRIWIRAADPADKGVELDEDRRTVGVIGMVSKNGKTITDAWYFRLQREYDRTGTFVIGKDVQLGFYESDYKAQGKELPAKPPAAAIPVKLDPDKPYTIRCGTLTIDDPMPNDATLPDWQLIGRLPDIDKVKQELLGENFKPTECEATFRTFPDSKTVAGNLSFLLGSCRYPGLLWKIKEADRIFGPMQKHFEGNAPARFTMMCGDQIYADTLNRLIPLGRADTFEEFQERYLTAYGAPNLRQLMRNSTSYMILDDHEIEDNWTQDRVDQGKDRLFNIAIGAYQSYQWSHSPHTFGRLLYYTFECGGYPVFVIDTRTQRYKDDLPGLDDNHLLGRPSLDLVNHPGQLQQLKKWLLDQQSDPKRGNVPKFIVTSSVFAPNDMTERLAPSAEDVKENPNVAKLGPAKYTIKELYELNSKRRDGSDSWPAYPNTRLELLKHIVENKIQNVVFLSGDIHCANTAAIEFDGRDAKDLKAFAVTSSAFYWPFPFANGDPNNYVHDSRAPNQLDPFPIIGTDAVMHYRSFGYAQEDNFSRLDIDKSAATITVRVFNRDGVPISVDAPDGKKTTQNVLSLAKW